MSEETAALVPRTEVQSVHLVARDPAGMKTAQGQMADWLKRKLSEIEMEVRELNAALNEARQNNWSTGPLTRQRNKAVASETYYFKLLSAVEAGYTLIPDFPIDVFAIRVTRDNVREGQSTGNWRNPAVDPELPDAAPAGEGGYKSPQQLVHTGSYKAKNADGSERTVHYATPYDFAEINFPVVAARPEVMNAAAEAMALKVFDQIGICLPIRNHQQRRWAKGDPLIIGQIVRRDSSGYFKVASFIIAWHLNLNDL